MIFLVYCIGTSPAWHTSPFHLGCHHAYIRLVGEGRREAKEFSLTQWKHNENGQAWDAGALLDYNFTKPLDLYQVTRLDITQHWAW